MEYIINASDKPECDDCIQKALSLSQRQIVNTHVRGFEAEGVLCRIKLICARCSGNKICAVSGETPPDNKERLKDPNYKSREDNKSNLGLSSLKSIGFNKVGLWAIDSGRLSLHLFSMRDARPALYAFVCGQEIKYIGKTSRKLFSRLYLYSRPGPSQSTNIRLNNLIISAIRDESVIDIYAFSTDERKHIGDFTLDIPAALEDDIIRKVSPNWNKRKSK